MRIACPGERTSATAAALASAALLPSPEQERIASVTRVQARQRYHALISNFNLVPELHTSPIFARVSRHVSAPDQRGGASRSFVHALRAWTNASEQHEKTLER